MFIGIVLIITIASIAILAIVNNYYIAFVNNYSDINEYYISKYAVISTIERWLNSNWLTVTWYSYPVIEVDGSYNYKTIWTGEYGESGNDLTISWYVSDYYNILNLKSGSYYISK